VIHKITPKNTDKSPEQITISRNRMPVSNNKEEREMPFRNSKFFLVLSLIMLSGFIRIASGDMAPPVFGPRLEGEAGDVQTIIERLTKQLYSEPYKAELYYHLAQAYSKQGWSDKAAQYMSQWIKLINSDMVVKDPYTFVIDKENDKVLAVDNATKQVVREIDVGWSPRSAIPTPDGARLYVTNALSDNVSAISAEKIALSNIIKTGRMPWNGTSSPQGDRVYIANLKSDDVSVIDTEKDTVVETMKVGKGPWGIAVSPDGHRLYVSNQDSRDIKVIDTGSYSIVDVIAVGKHPRDIALAPDDKSKLYAVDSDIVSDEIEIYVIDLEDARVARALNVPATNDPLLSRFEGMSLEDKLALIGSSFKTGEKSIPDSRIEMALKQALAPHSSSPPSHPLAARDIKTDPINLPVGGPLELVGPEPDMDAKTLADDLETFMDTEPTTELYAKVPSASTKRSTPLKQLDEPTKVERRILRIIIVVKNDTLWAICMSNYGMANTGVFREIQALNSAIKDVDLIYVGQSIRLPVLESETLYEGKFVIVEPDQNLFRIALNNYGIVDERTYDAIMRANPLIRDPNMIWVGQRIMLPTL
jgi:YVTN family beta-propeller protein